MQDRRFVRLFGALLVVISLFIGASAVAEENLPSDSVAKLTGMLFGTFRGSSPGNSLTIVSSRTGAVGNPRLENLEVRVTGTYQGDAVLLRGLWRISYQGDVLWLVFIPGVDSMEALRCFSDPTFSPVDLDTGCWVPLSSRNQGFEGRLKPLPNCRNAVRAGEVQSVGREWNIRIWPGGLRFDNGETGEVLSFSRGVGK